MNFLKKQLQSGIRLDKGLHLRSGLFAWGGLTWGGLTGIDFVSSWETSSFTFLSIVRSAFLTLDNQKAQYLLWLQYLQSNKVESGPRLTKAFTT